MKVVSRPRKRRSGISIAPPSVEDTNKVAEGFVFPTDNEKTIDNVLDDSTAATARDAAKKKQLQSVVAEIPEIFSPEQVAWVFDLYVMLISFVFSIALHTDFKAISEELKFDESEKNTMAIPLAKLLSKYAPSSWAGLQPEIQLITCLGVWTVTAFGRAKNIAAKVEEEKRKSQHIKEVTRPVSPMNMPTGVPA
jgi:hypothetical protein